MGAEGTDAADAVRNVEGSACSPAMFAVGRFRPLAKEATEGSATTASSVKLGTAARLFKRSPPYSSDEESLAPMIIDGEGASAATTCAGDEMVIPKSGGPVRAMVAPAGELPVTGVDCGEE